MCVLVYLLELLLPGKHDTLESKCTNPSNGSTLLMWNLDAVILIAANKFLPEGTLDEKERSNIIVCAIICLVVMVLVDVTCKQKDDFSSLVLCSNLLRRIL